MTIITKCFCTLRENHIIWIKQLNYMILLINSRSCFVIKKEKMA